MVGIHDVTEISPTIQLYIKISVFHINRYSIHKSGTYTTNHTAIDTLMKS